LGYRPVEDGIHLFLDLFWGLYVVDEDSGTVENLVAIMGRRW
jgi:hypothetical protein